MRNGVWVLAALFALSLVVGCSRSGATATAPLARMPQPTDTLEPPSTPGLATAGPTQACPPARGEGTVSPAVSIDSITFVVNGLEQVVRAGATLQALPGDKLQIREAIVCAGPFSGNGGEACVDLAPVDQSGQELVSEHLGTHMVPVRPGFVSISGPSDTWIVSENWRHISAVLNHWPPADTEDLACASGRCEHDDRMIVGFR